MTNINLENIQEHYKPFFKKIYYNENYIILLFLSIILLYFNPYLYFCILIAHSMFYINFETFDFNIKLNIKKDNEIETNNPLFNINKDEDYEEQKKILEVENIQSKLYNLVNLSISETEKKVKDDKEEENKESRNLINNSKKLENLNNDLDIDFKLLLKKNIEDNLKKLEENSLSDDKDDIMIVNHPLQ